MPRILNNLSGNSKIKCIEYDLGTCYQSEGRYVRLGFDLSPPHFNCILGHPLTKPAGPTLAERVSTFSSSSSEGPESMNLWEAAEAAQIVANNHFYYETIQMSELIASRLGIQITPLGTRNIPQDQTRDTYSITGLAMQGIERADEVIEFLSQEGYLSQPDKTALGPILQEMGEQLAAQSALTTEISPEQTAALRTFFEPILNEIIDKCASFTTSEDVVGELARWGRHIQAPIVRRDIAFASLVHASYDAYSLIDREFGELRAVQESADILTKIYWGTTEKESLLLESGIPVPSLSLQRKFLYELIEEKLNEKFEPEDLSRIPDHLNRPAVLEARKQIFIDGSYLEMIYSPRTFTIPSDPIRVDTLSHVLEALR